MTKYIGPRVRIIRRLGILPGLTRKSRKDEFKSPGQHGKLPSKPSSRSSLSDDYRNRLFEKQKLRFNYGVTEKQLVAYYHEAKKKTGSTGLLLLQFLEARLDCIVYRLGFAPTIPAARQIVNHGHILVNQKPVNIASFSCKKKDIIEIKEKESSKKVVGAHIKAQQEKRKLIQRRLKRINRTRSRFRSRTLLPRHLEVNEANADTFVGKILSPVKRKDVLVRINVFKVIEYYSR